MKTTLTNSYHRTSIDVHESPSQLDWLRTVASADTGTRRELNRVRKIRNALCGFENCSCGQTSLKERK